MAINLERSRRATDGSFDTGDASYLEYIFNSGSVQSLIDRHATNQIEISSPNNDADETTIINFSGLKRFIELDFRLIEVSGTDTSDGTAGYTVQTIETQYTYLKNDFISGDSQYQYRLTVDTIISNKLVGIVDFSITKSALNPNTYECRLVLSVGKNPIAIKSS